MPNATANVPPCTPSCGENGCKLPPKLGTRSFAHRSPMTWSDKFRLTDCRTFHGCMSAHDEAEEEVLPNLC